MFRSRVRAFVILGAAISAWGCALIAGADFDARLASTEEGGSPFRDDSGGGATDCPPPLQRCGRECVDTRASPVHCGACGTACPSGADGDPACVNGVCGLACHAGFGDCTNTPARTCAPLPTWYRDNDGDEFGTTETTRGCTRPAGYASVSGDCLDTNPAVHPDAAGAGTPFAGPTGFSFDYDCSGVEVEIGDPPHFTGCGPSCSEQGYIPATSRLDASPDADFYCGSPAMAICFDDGTGCFGTAYDSGSPIACR